jgi:hypothetical protein
MRGAWSVVRAAPFTLHASRSTLHEVFMGLREDVLGFDDAKQSLEPIRAFGQDLFVRVMSGAEYDDYEASQVRVELGDDGKRTSSVDIANLRARLAVKVLCDAEGQRIFQDSDAAALGKKSSLDLKRIFDAGRRLNGLDKDAVEQAKKNSASAPSSASGSGSA